MTTDKLEDMPFIFKNGVLVATCREIICIDETGFGMGACIPLRDIEATYDEEESTATFYSNRGFYVGNMKGFSGSQVSLQLHAQMPIVAWVSLIPLLSTRK